MSTAIHNYIAKHGQNSKLKFYFYNVIMIDIINYKCVFSQ